MSMPDPITAITVGGMVAGTVAGTVNAVAKQAQDFIAAATGHPEETIGTIFGNIFRQRRVNAESVASKAQLTLLNIGVRAGAVSLPVLMPILEGASLQEEPSMQDLWSNLLANAADLRGGTKVVPSYATILRDLTHEDAVFLDALLTQVEYEFQTNGLPTDMARFGLAQLQMTYDAAVLKKDVNPKDWVKLEPEFQTRMGIYTRLGLIDRLDNLVSVNGVPTVNENTRYFMTHLGHSFLKVCQAPKA
jgi:hypothetical protein